MITIGKIFSFSAAHHLPYHEGACARRHGHNFKLEVQITGPLQISGSSQGMIMDFSDLDKIVNDAVVQKLDHSNLNDSFTNPVAEAVIHWIAKEIQILLPGVIEIKKLKLWETEKCYAEWTDD